MTRRSLAAAALSAACLLANTSETAAKPPTLTGLFPAGGARGQSLTVTSSGSFDHWPVKCRVDGDGLAVKPAEKKGELAVEVAADARPGVYWLRAYDEEGATSLRPFIVGVLPEVMEVEPNDDPLQPQKVDGGRAVVNGRLGKTGDVDGFSVALEQGQVLVADLEANRNIGSPMDGVLQVVSADGFVLAQVDDAVGRDPRIVFQAPSKGTYNVRLFAFPAMPDSSIRFAGGDAYIYRLTLTTGGFVEHAFPLAASRKEPAEIKAVGPNIPEAGAALDAPTGDRLDRVVLAHPSWPGSATVRVVPGPAQIEVEPNDPDRAQPLPDQGSVSGRIDPPGDHDAYRIALKKGDQRVFRLESRAFGLPLDAVLQVLDAEGKTLAEADDAGESPDPVLSFTAPADGDFRVVVRDLNRRGGPHHAYLLGVVAPDPDFAPTLAADKFDVVTGTPAKIEVTIGRKDGFKEAIEVTAVDLPEGVTAKPATSKASDPSEKAVTIEIQGSGVAHAAPFRVVARSVEGDRRERTAAAKIAGFDADTDRPWLTVLPAPAPAATPAPAKP